MKCRQCILQKVSLLTIGLIVNVLSLRSLRCSAFALAHSKNAKEIHLALHNALLSPTDLENAMLKSKHLCLDLQYMCINSIGMAWIARILLLENILKLERIYLNVFTNK